MVVVYPGIRDVTHMTAHKVAHTIVMSLAPLMMVAATLFSQRMVITVAIRMAGATPLIQMVVLITILPRAMNSQQSRFTPTILKL
jgi:hypothetical protein